MVRADQGRSRVDSSTCGNPLMPSVEPATFAGNAAAAMVVTRQNSDASEDLPAEPELRGYAR
jgi:triacylglycerol lipase